MTTPSPAGSPDPAGALTTAEARALAERHGLRRVGHRPPLGQYLRELWEHRGFTWTLASAQNYARQTDSPLGQLWTVLNPLLLIGSYWLIFGHLLRTGRSVENFVGFLAAGLFAFSFVSACMTSGSKAIVGDLGLVRSLRFPRAILPITRVATELLTNIPAFGVLVFFMLVTGERPEMDWLFAPVALLFTTMIGLGMAFLLARIVNSARDVSRMVPVMVRLARYISGVFFPVAHIADRVPEGPLRFAFVYQPFAVMMDMMRQAFMHEFAVQRSTYLAGGAWAVLLLVVGFIVFYRGETEYGHG